MVAVAIGAVILSSVLTSYTSPTNVRDIDAPSAITRYKEARDVMEQKREEVEEEFRARKKKALEDIQTKKEEFREKLSKIKDERKQKVLTNLSERFSSVNSKWVTHWNNVLSRLTEILAKIDSKSDDPAVSDAVDSAEASVAAAQDAVNEQAGKTYDIEIDEEATLGEDVRALISQFHEDLRGVQSLVKSAREAVFAAFRALKSVSGSEENEPG